MMLVNLMKSKFIIVFLVLLKIISDFEDSGCFLYNLHCITWKYCMQGGIGWICSRLKSASFLGVEAFEDVVGLVTSSCSLYTTFLQHCK